MDTAGINRFAIILGVLSLLYFSYLWLFFLDVDETKPGVKRWEMFFRFVKVKKTRRLCHYHAMIIVHKGKFALAVSQSRCELCNLKRRGMS